MHMYGTYGGRDGTNGTVRVSMPGPAAAPTEDSNVFMYSLICDIDFIMVIRDHYLDTWVCLYSSVTVIGCRAIQGRSSTQDDR